MSPQPMTKKKIRTENFEGIVLSDRNTLAQLLADKKLYDLDGVAEIADLCVRYLRRLCAGKKVDHHKLLGRYYMTPEETAALLVRVPKNATAE